MAWTPFWTAGAEMQHVNELEEYSINYGGNSASISSTKAKTGTYSFATQDSNRPRGKSGAFANTVRAGYHINHNSATAQASNRSLIFLLLTTLGDIQIGWNASSGNLELVVNGTTQATVAATTGGFSTTNTWFHVGVYYKAGASSGVVSFYIDGVQKLTYTGNVGTQCNGIYGGGRTGVASNWNGAMYMDNFYIDTGDGSEADAAPNSYECPFQLVSAAGTSAAWTATGATPQFECVNETGAPNDNTDYVLAAAADLIDYYNTVDYTLPGGRVVSSVHPTFWALKSDAGIATTITPGLRLSGTDQFGSALTLPTTYGMVQGQVTRPGGGSFSQSDINSMELALKSSGAFA